MLENNILFKLYSKNRQTDVVSFDIFDTILFRKVPNPQDIFVLTAQKGIELQYIDKYLSPKEWMNLRIEAEKRARKNKRQYKGNSEANIFEIYNEMPSQWNKQALINLELQIESQNCYVNPEFIDFMQMSLSKKIILISDMYIPEKEMVHLLENVGILRLYYSSLYISCDYGYSKLDGKLYQEVVKREGNSIVHIGDNYISDVCNAKSNNILSEHYNILSSQKAEFLFDNIYSFQQLPYINNLRKLAYFETNGFWERLGSYTLGPFLVAFAEWVISYADENECDLILPIMREGYLFEAILRNEIIFRKKKIEVKKFYSSRESTHLICFKEWCVELYELLFKYKGKYKLGFILDYLELSNLQELMEYSECIFNDTKTIWINNDTNLYDYIWDILSENENVTKINNLINNKRRLFNSYYREEKKYFKKVLLVDIGYSATIQRNILNSLTWDNEEKPLCVIAIGDPNSKNHYFFDYCIRSFITTSQYGNKLRKILTNSIEILEQLLMNDEGSTVGYKFDNEKVYPITTLNMISKEEVKKLEDFKKGIIIYQELYNNVRVNTNYIKEKISDENIKLFDSIARMYMMPTYDEAKELLHLTYEDKLIDNKRRMFYELGDEQLLIKSGIELYLNYARENEVKWPEGVVTLFNPNYLFETNCQLNDYDGYTIQILSLVKKIVSDNIRFVVIYGAGELGNKIMSFLDLYKIEIIGFIDKSKDLHGKSINNIKIHSLESAIKKINLDNIIVASITYRKEISQTLEKQLPNSKLYYL